MAQIPPFFMGMEVSCTLEATVDKYISVVYIEEKY